MANLYESPEIERKRQMAQALLKKGLNPQPINGYYTGSNMLADALSAGIGGFMEGRADKEQRERTTAIQKTMAAALAGPQAPSDGVGPMQDRNQYLINTLAGNEATAPMALDYQLKRNMADADNEADMQRALRLAEIRKQTGADTPADILSFREVQKMNPQDRELFFQTKRGAQIKEIGGVPSVISGREVTPLSSLEREAAGVAAKEAAKTGAKETTERRIEAGSELPRIEDNAAQMTGLLDRLEKSDLGLIYGASAWVPIIPGTKQADVYSDWDQLQGKAFLEAFNSLKGGGQITEAEGKKATAAITSLSERRQTPRKAKEAIAELRTVIASGVSRQRKKAGSPEVPRANLQELGDDEILRMLNGNP